MPETKFRCPYCGVEFIEKSDNTKIRTIDYGRDADELAITGYTWLDHEIQARYHCCPACERYSVRITGFDNAFSLTYPPYTGMVLPDYIPEAIRTDYLETVVLLSKLKVDHHIEIELKMDELDLTAAESKATYDEIKAYVLNKYGLKVSQLYIAQIKRKCGIIERKNYNVSKKEDAKVPQCPPEKEAAIMDALKHFQMI